MPSVLPEALPQSLAQASPGKGSLIKKGPDGFLYALGLHQAKAGDGFALRYSGEWPADQGEPPLVGFARAGQVFGQGEAALLLVEYLLPGVDPTGARPEPWAAGAAPDVGKGLGTLSSVGNKEVALSLGLASGAQRGDRYLILGPASPGQRLGARVLGQVTVTDVAEEGTRARVDAGAGALKEGQWALFAGPGIVEPPLQCVVQVARIKDGDEQARQALIKLLKKEIAATGVQDVVVEALDLELDPLDPHLSPEGAGLPVSNTPRLLVASKVVKGELVSNYLNTGSSVAHAMIAATPEQGLALGDADQLTPRSIKPLVYNLTAAIETHRGDNARAIYLLEDFLRRDGWDGPARWHARDQLAMRWAQAGQLHSALRSVLEDIALAEARQDPDARINAVGTLMPLYEELGMMEDSLEAATSFYELRKEKGGDKVQVNHAWRAWIEALYKAGQHNQAQKQLELLEQGCAAEVEAVRQKAYDSEDPQATGRDSCVLDIYYGYLTFYWRTRGDDQRRQRYLSRLEELAPLMGDLNVAGLRVIQGLEAMRKEDPEGARIAFLEARRLFEKEESLSGMARVDSLNYQLFLSEEDRQLAFEAAMSSASLYARLRDLHELAGVYRSLTRLYVNVPPQDVNGAGYARGAQQTLAEALRLQMGEGDLGSAAEVFYVSGRFRMLSDPQQGQELLQRARGLSLRAARFDITSLVHLTLGFLDRARGDSAGFQQNMALAEDYARISGDAGLLQTVIRARSGAPAAPRETL